MKIRDAAAGDVAQMSEFLQQLSAMGKRLSRSDEEYVLANYVNDPDKIRCVVAEDDDGSILGFQSLKKAIEGNIYDVTPGWGIIGTHIRPSAARRGVGRALFEAMRQTAKEAGLKKIDASIGDDNEEGLAYYEAMGFRSYRTSGDVVCKCFDVTG